MNDDEFALCATGWVVAALAIMAELVMVTWKYFV